MKVEKEVFTVPELEEYIFTFELVRVIFRLDPKRLLPKYPYKVPAGDSSYLLKLHERIESSYPNIDFVILDGEGLTPGLRLKKLKQVRLSYVK